MEIYKNLPTELQKIIKYYTLSSPHTKKLKEFKRAIYNVDIRFITNINIYMESYFICNPSKNRHTVLHEDRDSYYTNINYCLRLKNNSYFNDFRFDMEYHRYKYFIQYNMSLKKRNKLSKEKFNKYFSKRLITYEIIIML